MKKKDFIFILGLTLFMAVLWIVGELVMGLWIAVVPSVRLAWRIGIVLVTLGISVWHAFIEDKAEEDPKKAKYERKAANRSKNKKKKR